MHWCSFVNVVPNFLTEYRARRLSEQLLASLESLLHGADICTMLPFSKSMFANILTFGFYLRVERYSVLVNDMAIFELSSNMFISRHEFLPVCTQVG